MKNDESAPGVDDLAIFEGKQIRRLFYNGTWNFAVVDIVGILTDSTSPAKYWSAMKSREKEKAGVDLSTFCRLLKMKAADGKEYLIETVNTKSALRIIQSVPSAKAEPFKKWMAQVGHERIQEIEDPELGTKRIREIYKAKGYPEDWIEKRMRSMAIRDELTGEWKNRGVREQKAYAILTAEISKATFGVTPSKHKQIKGLQRENLRDHMTDLELIFSMLGEAATTEITRNKNAQGFEQSRVAAKEGGGVAGKARCELEVKSGRPVLTRQNYLTDKPIKQLPSQGSPAAE